MWEGKLSDLSDLLRNLRDKRVLRDKKYKKILELIEKARDLEQKGSFLDAADIFEKAAHQAGKVGDEVLQQELIGKMEDCMIKGEEKRDKLDKMFSI